MLIAEPVDLRDSAIIDRQPCEAVAQVGTPVQSLLIEENTLPTKQHKENDDAEENK